MLTRGWLKLQAAPRVVRGVDVAESPSRRHVVCRAHLPQEQHALAPAGQGGPPRPANLNRASPESSGGRHPVSITDVPYLHTTLPHGRNNRRRDASNLDPTSSSYRVASNALHQSLIVGRLPPDMLTARLSLCHRTARPATRGATWV